MLPPAFALRLTPLALTLLTLTLAATALARPAPKPSPPIFARSVMATPNGLPNKPGESWKVDLVVRRDGSFTVGRDGESVGRISPPDLAALKKAIRKTRFIKEAPNTPMCTGFPNRTIRVQTTKGSISWAAPCARGPHRSVIELEQLVESLVQIYMIGRPQPRLDPPDSSRLAASGVLVSTSTSSMHALIDFESLVVNADGTWQRIEPRSGGATRGKLTTTELEDLRSRLVSVTFENPGRPLACAARLDGHGEVSIPGVGSQRWDIPCSSLSPSLSSLLTELRRLTAPTP